MNTHCPTRFVYLMGKFFKLDNVSTTMESPPCESFAKPLNVRTQVFERRCKDAIARFDNADDYLAFARALAAALNLAFDDKRAGLLRMSHSGYRYDLQRRRAEVVSRQARAVIALRAKLAERREKKSFLSFAKTHRTLRELTTTTR